MMQTTMANFNPFSGRIVSRREKMEWLCKVWNEYVPIDTTVQFYPFSGKIDNREMVTCSNARMSLSGEPIVYIKGYCCVHLLHVDAFIRSEFVQRPKNWSYKSRRLLWPAIYEDGRPYDNREEIARLIGWEE